MEERKELENPTLEFTFVTLLGGTGSDCEEDPENPTGDGQVKFCTGETGY